LVKQASEAELAELASSSVPLDAYVEKDEPAYKWEVLKD